ncbi:hypothetical protein ACH5RR_030614 [Cinchona calisaya]|uniref:FBD domain-containing protein n=1 Tax=Cinchona calisaya TaxID=153742 RepID=A0ABD2YV70_9GENT
MIRSTFECDQVPNRGSVYSFYLYSLIVASVQLEKLVVKFKFVEWARCEIVEFVGWHGLQVDTELAMFIIEHAVLQKVTINPRNQRVFDEELLSSTEKEEAIEEVARERARQLGNCSVSCCCIT